MRPGMVSQAKASRGGAPFSRRMSNAGPWLALLVLAAAGCKSTGAYDPRFSHQGVRVPPPSTGSYGAPNSYYTPPAATTGALPDPRRAAASAPGNSAFSDRDAGWRAPENPAVAGRPASGAGDSRVAATPRTGILGGLLGRLGGMPVNDATQVEPRRFSLPSQPRPLDSLTPPTIDYGSPTGGGSAATGFDRSGATLAGGTATAPPGANSGSSFGGSLAFRPPEIRRSTLTTPATPAAPQPVWR